MGDRLGKGERKGEREKGKRKGRGRKGKG